MSGFSVVDKNQGKFFESFQIIARLIFQIPTQPKIL